MTIGGSNSRSAVAFANIASQHLSPICPRNAQTKKFEEG